MAGSLELVDYGALPFTLFEHLRARVSIVLHLDGTAFSGGCWLGRASFYLHRLVHNRLCASVDR